MKKLLVAIFFALLIGSTYSQNSKWGVEIMGVEKTNYSMYYSKWLYASNYNTQNYIFFQPDYTFLIKYKIKNTDLKFGLSMINSTWKMFRSGTITVDVNNHPYFEDVSYSYTKILQEKSLLIPISIETKFYFDNKKQTWFLSNEFGLAYQYKYKIKNNIEDFNNHNPNIISDNDLKNEIFKYDIYDYESEVSRKDFKSYDKENKDMFQIFIINGVGYRFNKYFNTSLNLVNRFNIKRTKTMYDPEIKRWDGSIGIGLKMGIDF